MNIELTVLELAILNYLTQQGNTIIECINILDREAEKLANLIYGLEVFKEFDGLDVLNSCVSLADKLKKG